PMSWTRGARRPLRVEDLPGANTPWPGLEQHRRGNVRPGPLQADANCRVAFSRPLPRAVRKQSLRGKTEPPPETLGAAKAGDQIRTGGLPPSAFAGARFDSATADCSHSYLAMTFTRPSR